MQKVKKFSNDVYEFNFKTHVWTLILPKTLVRPHWRDFHTASAVDNKLYVFGGRMDRGQDTFTGESFYSNDLYAFDTQQKIWTQIKPNTSRNEDSEKGVPCGRRSHSAVVYKRKMIIFGGFDENSNKHFNELYEFNIDTSEWAICSGVRGVAPSPRRRHSCCIVDDRMFIFGGTGPSRQFNLRFLPVVQALVAEHLSRITSQELANLVPISNDQASANNMDVDVIVPEIMTDMISQLEPQNEYQENDQELHEYPESEDIEMENHETDGEDIIELSVEEIEEDVIELSSDEQEIEEDIIELSGDDESEDDYDDAEFEGLVSLSDLHVLDLEVSSLRNLTMIKIIKNKVNYDSLPMNLIYDLDSLTHIEKLG